MTATFYWHDYETSGIDPARDRPLQFAGLRTTLDLEPVGEPLLIYAQPARDVLPHPEACLVTGITPQEALAKGLPEVDFVRRIAAEMMVPQTCVLGYNSLRFDDEFTRFTLYRNLLDPYAREWQHGNSRWDLIDLARAAWALRPEGIAWPQHADGRPSFRLEDLTAANGIACGTAHDALVDVQATIAFARLLRQAQPRLWEYAYQLRQKTEVLRHLDPGAPRPLLHVSGRFGAVRHFCAVIAVLAAHPANRNEFIAVDLSADPDTVLGRSAEELTAALFAPSGSEVTRPPIKTLRANRAPFVAPVSVLNGAASARLSLDLDACQRNLDRLLSDAELPARLARVYAGRALPPGAADPELALYSGGFFSDADRRAMAAVHELSPEELAELPPVFADHRLPELLFRLRARNWPQTLSAAECAQWEEFRRQRLQDPGVGGLSLDVYRARIAALRAEPERSTRDLSVLDALTAWGDELLVTR